MSLILYAIESTKDEIEEGETLDGATTTVLQVMVLGLTFTEWMSKLREVSRLKHENTLYIFIIQAYRVTNGALETC